MNRPKALFVALALAVCLIAPAPPSIPGDGGEYLVLALNFARLKGPSIDRADMPTYMQQLDVISPGLASFDTYPFMRQARDGTLDYLHFWFYSLLATPGIWLTQSIGAPPTYAFALLNLALLLAALAVALPRLGGATSVLLFASPIVWWIDKPHTEPYTFALLAIAMLLLAERPWFAVIAAGAAAVQNPVAYGFLAVVLGACVVRDRRVVSDWRWILGASAAVALASLHAVYFWGRYRTPFPLADTTQPGWPVAVEILVPVLDPNLGLVFNFPWLPVMTIAAIVVLAVRTPRALISAEVLAALAAGVVFLLGFARNVNYHHGGTPSISRYALWLIPLAIPLLRGAADVSGAWWRGAMWMGAVASAAISIYAFHPIVVQNSREPTWAAQYLWTTHPLWNDPLPQTFVESLRKTEDPLVPTATEGCEKILLSGRRNMRVWPMPCYPELLPSWCVSEYCYANLADGKYVFSRAPGRDRGPGKLLEHEAWPIEAESRVREFYAEMGWHTLRPGLEPNAMFRQLVNAHADYLQGDGRTIVVIHEAERDAAVVLRPPGKYQAVLFDPVIGRVLSVSSFDGPANERWEIPIPQSELLLLGLTARSASAP